MTDTMTRPQSTYPFGSASDSGDTYAEAGGPPPVLPPPRSHRGDRRWPRRFAGGLALLALVGGGGVAGGLVAEHYRDTGTTGAATTATAASATVTDGDSLAAVAAQVSPSIVTVMVDSTRSTSLGSGVVLSADGLILTNNHVIAGDGTVSVRLSDGRTLPASVVAADTTHDLALVRIQNVSGLTPATFAPDSSVAVGDTVLAFGAPLGLEGTVTSGIVSALDRQVNTGDEQLTGLLQTDAPINEGNSGGALVDTSGHVIGINVAIATASDGSTGSVGVGFAIPSDTVGTVVKQLESQER